VTVLVYVNDFLLYAKDNDDMDSLLKTLKTEDILIHCEGSAEGFLGINIECNGNKMVLT